MGRKVGTAVRIAHLANLVAGSMLWMGLGAALWFDNVPGGPICGGDRLGRGGLLRPGTTPTSPRPAFVFGGALPALAMLVFVIAGPNPHQLPLIPIVGLLILALSFVADGVMRSLGVRRSFEAAQRRTAASEAHYRLLADNVTDVIALTGPDRSRLYVSPSIEKALGYTPDELQATPNYTYLYPEDRERVPGRHRSAVARG